MRALLLAILLLPTASFAHGTFADSDYSEFCAGAEVLERGYVLECREAFDFATLSRAKAAEALKQVPKRLAKKIKDAYSLGIMPDADTNLIYAYVRVLNDEEGAHVGYLVIEGYENSEMETKVQISTRYNMEGDLTSARLKGL